MNINYQESLERIARSYCIYPYVKKVLETPKFLTCSGSGDAKHHHYGEGGLIRHTYEVVMFCISTYQTKSFVDGDSMFDPFNLKETLIAAYWHDYGKIWDYQVMGNIWGKHDDHARKIGHISRSLMEFDRFVMEFIDTATEHILFNVSPSNIRHCILSHHGCREWGSPVSPATKEAWVLHLSDMLSARLDDCYLYDKF